MNGPEPNLSRTNRKKGRKWSNNLLNILIGVVVVLIIIFSVSIFNGDKDSDKAAEEETLLNEETAADKDDVPDKDNEQADASKKDDNVEESDNAETGSDEKTEIEEAGSEKSGQVTYVSSDDKLISETIIKTAWEPIGTSQTGDHVSRYDGNSVDWKEKQEALAYATGLSTDSMIFWKIKNGGDPQKSIGIVSSKDSAEKYRVYLEWVEEQGWKPVKMDVLTSLDFDY